MNVLRFSARGQGLRFGRVLFPTSRETGGILGGAGHASCVQGVRHPGHARSVRSQGATLRVSAVRFWLRLGCSVFIGGFTLSSLGRGFSFHKYSGSCLRNSSNSEARDALSTTYPSSIVFGIHRRSHLRLWEHRPRLTPPVFSVKHLSDRPTSGTGEENLLKAEC